VSEDGSAYVGVYAVRSDEESACSGYKVGEVGDDLRCSIVCREGDEGFVPLPQN